MSVANDYDHERVIEALRANGGQVVDNASSPILSIKKVVVLKRSKHTYACAFFEGHDRFNLFPMYLHYTGEVHLSTIAAMAHCVYPPEQNNNQLDIDMLKRMTEEVSL